MRPNVKHDGLKGELKAAGYLADLGFHIFKELGDCSRVDLICYKKGRPLTRVQVKALEQKSRDGYIVASLSKRGVRNYVYDSDDFDILAIWAVPVKRMLFVPIRLFSDLGVTGFNIRTDRETRRATARVFTYKAFTSYSKAVAYQFAEDNADRPSYTKVKSIPKVRSVTTRKEPREGVRKFEWPTPTVLQELVWAKPVTKIGADFGVSDVAIKKICKKYGTIMPPKGYHLMSASRKRKYVKALH